MFAMGLCLSLLMEVYMQIDEMYASPSMDVSRRHLKGAKKPPDEKVGDDSSSRISTTDEPTSPPALPTFAPTSTPAGGKNSKDQKDEGDKKGDKEIDSVAKAEEENVGLDDPTIASTEDSITQSSTEEEEEEDSPSLVTSETPITSPPLSTNLDTISPTATPTEKMNNEDKDKDKDTDDNENFDAEILENKVDSDQAIDGDGGDAVLNGGVEQDDSIDCTDIDGFYFDGKTRQTCMWMATNGKCERMEAGQSVAEYWCPRSCGRCDCYDIATFNFDGKPDQNCTWMAEHDKCEEWRMYDDRSVKTYWCPVACGGCGTFSGGDTAIFLDEETFGPTEDLTQEPIPVPSTPSPTVRVKTPNPSSSPTPSPTPEPTTIIQATTAPTSTPTETTTTTTTSSPSASGQIPTSTPSTTESISLTPTLGTDITIIIENTTNTNLVSNQESDANIKGTENYNTFIEGGDFDGGGDNVGTSTLTTVCLVFVAILIPVTAIGIVVYGMKKGLTVKSTNKRSSSSSTNSTKNSSKSTSRSDDEQSSHHGVQTKSLSTGKIPSSYPSANPDDHVNNEDGSARISGSSSSSSSSSSSRSDHGSDDHVGTSRRRYLILPMMPTPRRSGLDDPQEEISPSSQSVQADEENAL